MVNRMRVALVLACLGVVIVGTMAASSRARGADWPRDPSGPPCGVISAAGGRPRRRPRARARVDLRLRRHRGRLAAHGELDDAGALLDTLQDLQRADGALDASYDLRRRRGCRAAALGQRRRGSAWRRWSGARARAQAATTGCWPASRAGCSRTARGTAWCAAGPTSPGYRPSTTSSARVLRWPVAGLTVEDDGRASGRRPSRSTRTLCRRRPSLRQGLGDDVAAARRPGARDPLAARSRPSRRRARRSSATTDATHVRRRPPVRWPGRQGRRSAATARSPTGGPGRAVDGGDADDAPRQGAARPRRRARSTTAPTAGRR